MTDEESNKVNEILSDVILNINTNTLHTEFVYQNDEWLLADVQLEFRTPILTPTKRKMVDGRESLRKSTSVDPAL